MLFQYLREVTALGATVRVDKSLHESFTGTSGTIGTSVKAIVGGKRQSLSVPVEIFVLTLKPKDLVFVHSLEITKKVV